MNLQVISTYILISFHSVPFPDMQIEPTLDILLQHFFFPKMSKSWLKLQVCQEAYICSSTAGNFITTFGIFSKIEFN